MSIAGVVLAVLYLLVAGWVWLDETRHQHGGFINLRGFGTRLLTAPSQATLGGLLRRCGVPRPDWQQLGWRGHAEIGAHVALTAALVYAFGWALGWTGERLAAAVWS